MLSKTTYQDLPVIGAEWIYADSVAWWDAKNRFNKDL